MNQVSFMERVASYAIKGREIKHEGRADAQNDLKEMYLSLSDEDKESARKALQVLKQR